METARPEGPGYDPVERICIVSAAIAARSLRLATGDLPSIRQRFFTGYAGKLFLELRGEGKAHSAKIDVVLHVLDEPAHGSRKAVGSHRRPEADREFDVIPVRGPDDHALGPPLGLLEFA